MGKMDMEICRVPAPTQLLVSITTAAIVCEESAREWPGVLWKREGRTKTGICKSLMWPKVGKGVAGTHS